MAINTNIREVVLMKLGEIVLKGLNRRTFEQKLVSNIARRMRRYGSCEIYSIQSTIYLSPNDDSFDLDGAYEAVKKIFGIISVSRAAVCEKDKDIIVETAKSYLHDQMSRAKSFKVESKRSDKKFPMTSIELSQYVGGRLNRAFPAVKVDVHDPEIVVNIEIREKGAYIHGKAEPGAGGMPVGINSQAVSLLSGGIDSPVSTYMIAKRGVAVTPVHFFSYPYTSQRAKEKVIELARELVPYCGRMSLQIVPFTKIQESIRDNCPENYFTIIMRRFMMRIAQRVAENAGAKCIVTGESLGQVASQTMEAMAVTGAVCTLPVFRPVIGMDKEEIVTISRKIGTFDTSILPYEDCCTVFTPKHPKIKPSLGETLRAEAKLDVDALVNEAVDNIEVVTVEL